MLSNMPSIPSVQSGDEDDEVSSDDEQISSLYFEHDDIIGINSPHFASNSANSSLLDLTQDLNRQSQISFTNDEMDPPSRSSTNQNLNLNSIHILKIVESLNCDEEAWAAVQSLDECVRSNDSVIVDLDLRFPWDLLVEKIKLFFTQSDTQFFCLGLRIVRVFFLNKIGLQILNEELYLNHIFAVVMAFDFQEDLHNCRLYAIQAIRAYINTSKMVSKGVCRALVAVAEQQEDKIRPVCIETLAELMVVNPELPLEAGSIRVLLSAMCDSSINMSSPELIDSIDYSVSLGMALVGAFDNPNLRTKFLRNGRDLNALLAVFSDNQMYGFMHPSMEQLVTSAAVIKLWLRTWVGLCSFDIFHMVKCLTLPVASIQSTLLDILNSVLWISEGPEKPSLLKNASALHSSLISNQFTAILLLRLQTSDLHSSLEFLATNGQTAEIREMALKLESKIYTLSSRLIANHEILSRSAKISNEMMRKMETIDLGSLPTASMNIFDCESQIYSNVCMFTPTMDSFIKFGMSIDDLSFKRLLHSTHVLDTKQFKAWNWDALKELIMGPLKSPKRLDEIKNTKYMKRLLSFFRPFKYRFSILAVTREHIRYAEVAKELMKTFLETAEGVRFLSNNKLFRQIAECIAQLDPTSGIQSIEPLFSIRRFRTTCCAAYVEMVGVLSQQEMGQQILAQMRIFNMLYRVCDTDREDVIRSILCSLDYRIDGHPRLILAKALNSKSRTVRLFATEFTGHRFAGLSDPNFWVVDMLVEQLYDSEKMVLRAAVQSLHNLCASSVQNLDYLISLNPVLEYLKEDGEPIRMLFMTRSEGLNLLISDPRHADFLLANNFNQQFVEKIESYLEGQNRTYKTENDAGYFSKSIDPFKFPTYSRPSRKYLSDKSEPPAHFYGELATTERGTAYLSQRGDLDNLCFTIKQAAINCELVEWGTNQSILLEVKAALWAIGHLGSQNNGASLINNATVQAICKIAKSASVYSLRGTAYYAISLLAMSSSGSEHLHQCEWNVVYDSYGLPIGVATPPSSFHTTPDALTLRKSYIAKLEYPLKSQPQSRDLEAEAEAAKESAIYATPKATPSTTPQSTQHTFTNQHLCTPPLLPSIPLEPTSPDFDFANVGTQSQSSPPGSVKRENSQEIDTILLAVSQLGSSVLSSSATKRLLEIHNTHPELFKSRSVLNEVLQIFAAGHYQQASRRFVAKLFDYQEILAKVFM